MPRWIKRSLWGTVAFLVVWAILTIWAEQPRIAPGMDFGPADSRLHAWVVYNPDPFYNLDRQVCEAFASAMAGAGWHVRVRTLADSPTDFRSGTDLFAVCANTYNWAPDRPSLRFIADAVGLEGKPAVAITLGSGSTSRSKRLLESALSQKKARVLLSETYWLMRPNDEARMEDPNVEVACDKARELGTRTAALMQAAKGLQNDD